MKITIKFESLDEQIKVLESIFNDFATKVGVLDYSAKQYENLKVTINDLITDHDDFEGISYAEIAAVNLIENTPIEILDTENDTTHELTLDKIVKGLELYAQNEKQLYDYEKGSEYDSDQVLQYALFGEIVYI